MDRDAEVANLGMVRPPLVYSVSIAAGVALQLAWPLGFVPAGVGAPYRYSRNSIYLAFSLLQLGIALWVNGIWLVLTLVPAVLLMSLVVIPGEEAFLAARFPSKFLPYKDSVRRWL